MTSRGLSALGAVVIAACLSADVGLARTASSDAIRARITLSMRTDGKGFVVYGTTNLPSGTKLILSVADQAYVQYEAAHKSPPSIYAAYSAESDATVVRGRFKSGRFTYHGRSFPSGRYRAEATMPIARVQPARVRAIIGSKGQNLTGPNVQQFGSFGAVVEVKSWFKFS